MLRCRTEAPSVSGAACGDGREMRRLCHSQTHRQLHLPASPAARGEGAVPPARGCGDFSLPSPCNQLLAEQSLRHHRAVGVYKKPPRGWLGWAASATWLLVGPALPSVWHPTYFWR